MSVPFDMSAEVDCRFKVLASPVLESALMRCSKNELLRHELDTHAREREDFCLPSIPAFKIKVGRRSGWVTLGRNPCLNERKITLNSLTRQSQQSRIVQKSDLAPYYPRSYRSPHPAYHPRPIPLPACEQRVAVEPVPAIQKPECGVRILSRK